MALRALCRRRISTYLAQAHRRLEPLIYMKIHFLSTSCRAWRDLLFTVTTWRLLLPHQAFQNDLHLSGDQRCSSATAKRLLGGSSLVSDSFRSQAVNFQRLLDAGRDFLLTLLCPQQRLARIPLRPARLSPKLKAKITSLTRCLRP